ncbi:MAG TPA: hypothetical protein PLE71_13420, partial [Flavobacteriales bacterium]|nr:hypothetical protein [Flavobacteriales bacterium]
MLSVTWTSHVKHFWHAGSANSSMIMAAQFKVERLIECELLGVLVEWFMVLRFLEMISFRWVQNSCDHLALASPIAWMAEMGERMAGCGKLEVLAVRDTAWNLCQQQKEDTSHNTFPLNGLARVSSYHDRPV